MNKNFADEYKRVMIVIVLWTRRIYVVAFNVYAWYWLYRQIFIRQSTDFEEYFLWAFTTFGMYFFVLDSKGIFLESKKK
ncbi:hypothetical protein SAMN05428988_4390 [Chitinophaga sp. YR573]|nr:hypothetical protein SAMN05428988_4390 [Chitinophaga sp. YR573]